MLADITRKEKLFSTYGRVGRLSYFLRTLVIYIVTLVALAGAIFVLFNFVPHHISNQMAPLAGGIVALIGSVIIALQAVKRFHDLNRPGTHFWFLLVPIYGLYIGLLLIFKKGTSGPNDFGEDPLTQPSM